MNITIANRLVELRKKNGYSQEQLADLLGLSRQAVSKWERAEASPDTDNLICLAKIYGISLDELLSTDQTAEEIRSETKEKEEEKKEENSEIHLRDEDGSEIHITKNGIYGIDEDGASFEIKKDGAQVQIEGKEDDVFKRNKKKSIVRDIVSGSSAILILIAYLILGFVLPPSQGWAVYWTLFLLVPVIATIYEAIEKRKFTAFAYPVLVTFVYCFVGMQFHIWHPTWILFLTIPVYYIVFDPIDKLIQKKTEN